MNHFDWMLRVRRREGIDGWTPTERRVRCVLVPTRMAVERDGIQFSRIPFEELPGETIPLPEGFHSVRTLRLRIEAEGPQGEERKLVAITARAEDGQLHPFTLVGAAEGSNPAAEMRELLAKESLAPTPENPEPAGEVLPWALDHLYRTDQPLEEAVKEDGREVWPLVLAAASELVFDATLRDLILNDGQIFDLPLGDGVLAKVRVQSDERLSEPALAPVPRIVEAKQYPHGFTFRLRLAEGDAEDPFDGEHRVHIERWAGPAPAGRPEFEQVRGLPDLAAHEATEAFHATDALLPADRVGSQLHYRIGLINSHGRVVATGSTTQVRERLDAPAPATEPRITACFPAGVGTPELLDLEVGLGAARNDDLAWSSLALYAEDRALDACGFYGDADDLALNSGMAALDLTGLAPPLPARDPNASLPAADENALKARAYEPPNPLDRVARQELEGRWATEGLRLVAVRDLHDVPPPPSAPQAAEGAAEPRVRLPLYSDAGPAHVLPQPGLGRRYHVVRFRRRRSDAARQPAVAGWRVPTTIDRQHLTTSSAAVVCAHAIAFRAPEELRPEDRIPVFQVERISDPGERRFLSSAHLGIQPVDPKASPPPTPVDLTLRLRHPRFEPPGDDAPTSAPVLEETTPIPVGGFRIWMRDVLGAAEPEGAPPEDARGADSALAATRRLVPEPFRPLATLQAVPELVASYRPVPLDGATPWRFVDVAGDVEGKVFGPAPTEIELARARLRDFGKALQKNRGLRADAAPLAPTEAGAAGRPLEQVFAKRFEAFSVVPGPWEADPRFPGTLVGAMDELGLCLRVSVGIEVAGLALRAPAGGAARLRDLNAAGFAGLAAEGMTGDGLSVWIAEDDAHHPYATLLVMPRLTPPVNGEETAWLRPLLDAMRRAQGGEPVGGFRVRLLRQMPAERVTRAFGPDRTCAYTWHGITDRWAHETEWAIEVLDRYDHVRRVRSPRADFELDESLGPAAVPGAARTRVRVPRTAPVLDRVEVVRDLDSRPDRLVFRYDDPPERRAAARNALNATRFGELRVAHILDHELVGREAYASFLRDTTWKRWHEEPGPPGGWSETDLSSDLPLRSAPAVRGPLEERLDLGHLPPYYLYTCTARLAADAEAGPDTRATGRVEPTRLGLPTAVRLTPDIDLNDPPERQYGVQLTFRLARLSQTHADLDRRSRPATLLMELFATELHDRPDLGQVLVSDLPDLELGYHFYLDLGGESAPDLVPLLELQGKAVAAPSGHPFPHFEARLQSPWGHVNLVPWREHLGIMVEVYLKPQPEGEAEGFLWTRVRDALHGTDSGAQLPGYVELVRQGRSSGLQPAGRTR